MKILGHIAVYEGCHNAAAGTRLIVYHRDDPNRVHWVGELSQGNPETFKRRLRQIAYRQFRKEDYQLAKQRITDLGLRVSKVNTKDEGHCNFCTTRTYSVVFEVWSAHPDKRMRVRVCHDCMTVLKREAK